MIEEKADRVLKQLKQDAKLGPHVDGSLPIPKPYRGKGEIRLVVLGQDPTVKNAEDRKFITTVLNLDRSRSARAYLARVCDGLGCDIAEHVYGTNLYKNFFVDPPAQITEIDIFHEFLGAWLPLLKEELAQFEDIPVITLGEPILGSLAREDVPTQVRHYWGYTPEWKDGHLRPFLYIRPRDNELERNIFPFPHLPSLRKQFYKARMRDYIAFVRATAFL